MAASSIVARPTILSSDITSSGGGEVGGDNGGGSRGRSSGGGGGGGVWPRTTPKYGTIKFYATLRAKPQCGEGERHVSTTKATV